MKSKYLMFIPVAALLVLFSNCTNTAEEATKEEEKVDVKFVPTEVKSDTIDTQDEVLDMVEVMPEFPGGVKALMSYLAKTSNTRKKQKMQVCKDVLSYNSLLIQTAASKMPK